MKLKRWMKNKIHSFYIKKSAPSKNGKCLFKTKPSKLGHFESLKDLGVKQWSL
jgi:hypothetical protein